VTRLAGEKTVWNRIHEVVHQSAEQGLITHEEAHSLMNKVTRAFLELLEDGAFPDERAH
jgi:hypothetical protein